jgi:hypothetical protein
MILSEIISRVQQDDLERDASRIQMDRDARAEARAKSKVKVYTAGELLNSLAGEAGETELDSDPRERVLYDPTPKRTGFPAPPAHK